VAADTPSPFADGRHVPLSDPFEILGFAPAFELDPLALEARHRELSRALHPDRYAGRPASERKQALGRAIEVNDAARTLKNPIRRAQALLARRGQPVSETSSPPASPELLMTVMELREGLGAARREHDLPRVRELTRQVRASETKVTRALAEGFAAVPPDYRRIETLLGELRYYARFLEEAGAIEDDLDGAAP
jgi:molecular chaperone HscB